MSIGIKTRVYISLNGPVTDLQHYMHSARRMLTGIVDKQQFSYGEFPNLLTLEAKRVKSGIAIRRVS